MAEEPTGTRFEHFRDSDNDWRWRLIHKNGNVIAVSGEGYNNYTDCMRESNKLSGYMRGAKHYKIDGSAADVVNTSEDQG